VAHGALGVVPLDRRQFLVRTGLAFATAEVLELVEAEEPRAPASVEQAISWEAVRNQFRLSRRWVHLGGLLLASHPTVVRRAIERHRRALDANPVHYLHGRGPELDATVWREAARYLGAPASEIALTDSTTMGVGIVFNGIDLRAGQEALTTTHDFFATHEALRLKAARSGASVRMIQLYARPGTASEDEIVGSITRAVRPETRVLAVTWVHSSTGVKLPIRSIADALAEINARRDERSHVLLCVDAVHGLGVENVTMAALRCDFFIAGCHKWLFGPRGTGVVWGSGRGWAAATPTIPSFDGGATAGRAMTPGGFHSFEHRWALADAFAFHRRIGKRRVAARIHALNRRFKEGLATMPHVTVYTPHSPDISAGIVCFDVRGLSPDTVVARLRGRRIIATVTPYSPSYARVAPGLLNTPREIDRALAAIRALA
jgi:isopenicillin-N epimerase